MCVCVCACAYVFASLCLCRDGYCNQVADYSYKRMYTYIPMNIICIPICVYVGATYGFMCKEKHQAG